MKKTKRHLPSVVVFCGGTGSAALCQALLASPISQITCVINAYDDGKSTGAIRRLFEMLGPSDFRKNHSHALVGEEISVQALKSLWDFRFPAGTTREEARSSFRSLLRHRFSDRFGLADIISPLSVNTSRRLWEFSEAFWEMLEVYESGSGTQLDFGDCSLANCLYAGAFERYGRVLNRAVAEVEAVLELGRFTVQAASEENRWLSAVLRTGALAPSEEATDVHKVRAIAGVYSLVRRLDAAELLHLSRCPAAAKCAYLRHLSALAQVEPACLKSIRGADIIVYSPCTYATSLLPTLRVSGISEAVRSNRKALKVVVTNITTQGGVLTTSEALRQIGVSLGVENPMCETMAQYVSGLVANRPGSDRGLVRYDRLARWSGLSLRYNRFSDPRSPDHHDGKRVVEELLAMWT